MSCVSLSQYLKGWREKSVDLCQVVVARKDFGSFL